MNRALWDERRRQMLADCREVCNEPLRRRLIEARKEGLTTTEVCTLMGWTRLHSETGRPVADTSRLYRVVGLRLPPRRRGGCYPRMRETISYDVAVRLAEVLGMDPHEAGL